MPVSLPASLRGREPLRAAASRSALRGKFAEPSPLALQEQLLPPPWDGWAL